MAALDFHEALKKLIRIKNQYSEAELEHVKGTGESIFKPVAKFFQPGYLQDLDEFTFHSFLMQLHDHKHIQKSTLKGIFAGDFKEIATQLDDLIAPMNKTKGINAVVKNQSFGKPIAGACLHASDAKNLMLWDSEIEGALRILNIWPKYIRNIKPGALYLRLNEVVCYLAKRLEVDLWTMSVLLKKFVSTRLPHEPNQIEGEFSEFLITQWEAIAFGKAWELLEYYGETVTPDCELITPFGSIDFLVRHKTERKRVAVIKLGGGSDPESTISQLILSMGWVKGSILKARDKIEGWVFTTNPSKEFNLATEAIPNIHLHEFDLSFRVVDQP